MLVASRKFCLCHDEAGLGCRNAHFAEVHHLIVVEVDLRPNAFSEGVRAHYHPRHSVSDLQPQQFVFEDVLSMESEPSSPVNLIGV